MELIVDKLTHVYGKGTPFEQKAIENISFHIPSGQFAAIIGQTGSGKSTLIQHLNGLLRPSSGTVTVGDFQITAGGKRNLRELRRQVGLVFQYPEYQLFEETLEKDIAYGLKNYKVPPIEMANRVREVMNLVGLDFDRYKDVSPFSLSGGQMRRAAIAGVLVLQPKVLILDEPAAGLDPRGREEILEKIYQLHKSEHRTTILVTHNMEDAARYADQIIVLKDGGTAMQGTPAEVFAQGERLRRMGLDLPEITQFILQLNERLDSPIRTDIFTVEELEREILRRWKGKRR